MADSIDLLRHDMAELRHELRDVLSEIRGEVGQVRLQQLDNTERLIAMETAITGNGTKGLGERVSGVEDELHELLKFEESEHGTFRVLLVGMGLVGGLGTAAVSAIKLLAG